MARRAEPHVVDDFDHHNRPAVARHHLVDRVRGAREPQPSDHGAVEDHVGHSRGRILVAIADIEREPGGIEQPPRKQSGAIGREKRVSDHALNDHWWFASRPGAVHLADREPPTAGHDATRRHGRHAWDGPDRDREFGSLRRIQRAVAEPVHDDQTIAAEVDIGILDVAGLSIDHRRSDHETDRDRALPFAHGLAAMVGAAIIAIVTGNRRAYSVILRQRFDATPIIKHSQCDGWKLRLL